MCLDVRERSESHAGPRSPVGAWLRVGRVAVSTPCPHESGQTGALDFNAAWGVFRGPVVRVWWRCGTVVEIVVSGR
jgi:hypothetical protein